MIDIAYEQILAFWFGDIEGELSSADKQRMWYRSNPETDHLIRERFHNVLELADRGELKHWLDNPQGRLAMILLFDQFTRNIYRGSAQAFSYDDKALDLCQQGIEKGEDKQLRLVERLFFYHPLEHAEDKQVQQQSVACFAALLQEYPEGEQHLAALNAYHFAVEHRDIVHEFGRFPHRNKVLGRVSSEQEQRYLQQGGKRFGQ
ncbi:DUF924 family protein [Lacimicrobium sp. SS2-24]|uniref:DUF924 family protein n=1 Tax=Lacimicrobium sp. SS2-24 TaxID=2005569 RepID=UPI000B4B513C|nr:DUF924 family protein [Lacimicrobium sp. SS2-24]